MKKKVYSKETAYNYIRDKITTCKYAPGEFLNETALSEEIGVSRTPVREALNMLERENLVEIFPKRGIQVTNLTLSNINEIYQVRELVETYIVKFYAKDIDKAKLLNIRRLLMVQSENSSETDFQYQIDSDLHQVILSANRNRYFSMTLENVYAQNHRVRIMTGRRTESRLNTTREEHISIIEAILMEDYDGAACAMQQHLKSSKEAAIRSMLY